MNPKEKAQQLYNLFRPLVAHTDTAKRITKIHIHNLGIVYQSAAEKVFWKEVLAVVDLIKDL